jgi:hypothetical protein
MYHRDGRGMARALLLRQRRCWRRARGRGTRIGELQRLERFNEAESEIVVAFAWRESLRSQDVANVGRRQFRIGLQQERHDAAHLGSRTDIRVVS